MKKKGRASARTAAWTGVKKVLTFFPRQVRGRGRPGVISSSPWYAPIFGKGTETFTKGAREDSRTEKQGRKRNGDLLSGPQKRGDREVHRTGGEGKGGKEHIWKKKKRKS